MPNYDLEAVYDAEIAPLMTKIIEVCEQHGLPMLASFCYANDDESGSNYCTSMIRREDWLPDELAAALRAMRKPRGQLMAFTIINAAK